MQPVPEKPISPYYDFYKLLLISSDRMEGGTAADCVIPLSFSTSGSMGVGTWQFAVEACSIIKHAVLLNALPRGMSIVSDNFRDPYGHQFIGHLSKSDDTWFRLRMTNKPITKDLVGVNVTSALDGMSSNHIGIRDSETLEALDEPENVDEWLTILAFYRVDYQCIDRASQLLAGRRISPALSCSSPALNKSSWSMWIILITPRCIGG